MNFLIGCYFTDYLPVLHLADTLDCNIIHAISNQNLIDDFKKINVKKSPIVKEV